MKKVLAQQAALLAGAALLVAPAAYANDQVDTTMDTMKVWTTKVEKESSLLTDEIELKQADHLSDLLRDQAGVDIGGSHALNQSINIRGISELDLDIRIDGASQTNNVFHHAGNLLVNPDILKAVDIRVGNNSVINGGLGGGISFETKDAKDLLQPGQDFGARLNTGFATNDYYNYSITTYGQFTDWFDGLLYYSGLDRNNPTDGDGVEQVGEEGKTENILAKFGFDMGEHNRLELSYDYYRDHGDYTLKSNFGDYDHASLITPLEYTRETIALNHELNLGNTTARTSLYRNEMNYRDKESEIKDKAGNIVDVVDAEGNVVVYGINTLAETAVDLAGMMHTTRYGFDFTSQESERTNDGEVVSNKKGVESTENADSYGIFLEDEINLVGGLFVTPGLRYNYYDVDMVAVDKSYTDLTWALAARYEFENNWTISASATELFKGPALSGSYLASNSAYNDALKPETGMNYEAGVAYESENVLGLDSFGFSTTFFYTEIDDYINDTMTGKSLKYSNEGDAEVYGFESTLQGRLGDFNGRLTYSHSESEFVNIIAGSDFIIGQALDDTVGDSISMNLGYDIPAYNVSLNWTSMFAFSMDMNDAENTKKDAYDVHSVSVSWVLPVLDESMLVTASVENIFDEHYGSHASHDMGFTDYEPGRNFKLSLSYQF